MKPAHVNFSSREAAAEALPLADIEKIKTYVSMQLYIARNEAEDRAPMATDAAYRDSEELYNTLTEREQRIADATVVKLLLAMVGK